MLPNKVDGVFTGSKDCLIDGQKRRFPSVGFVLHQDDKEEPVEDSLQELQRRGAFVLFLYHDFN